jgi:hypothetical protein
MGVRHQLKRLGWLVIRLADAGARKNQLDLSGDRDVEWSWIAGNLPECPGRVLDFGPSSAASGLIAAFKGGDVLGLDLEVQPRSPYVHPQLSLRQGDLLTYDFGTERFDTIINCSTVEHVGLFGRYGSGDVPDGDLQAMQRMRALMRGPESRMLMTIPVGVDGVFAPAHRVYGPTRFPKLTAGFSIIREMYFRKPQEDQRWKATSRENAFMVPSSASFYALGLFVLAPA